MGWDEGVRLTEPEDLNPDPTTLELNLEARVADLPILGNVTTPVWTYGGSTPGPLLRAHKGDRLSVHFANNLPEASTIHWHGIRLPAAMDGVPGHTQAAVPPGGTFDYTFQLPDAGLFWYHPHADSAAQVGFGLYGAILVEDPDEPRDLGDEVVLVLSDMSIEPDGSITQPDDDDNLQTLRGREGETLLVNGRVRPTLLARSGRRQRWRIVNTAKSRYFQLALPGHQFTRIGTDGGLLQAPDAPTDTMLIIPGGRTDILVTPSGAPGDVLAVQFVPYDRGFGTAVEGAVRDLFYLNVVDRAAGADGALPATLRTIVPTDTAGAIERTISLTVGTANGRVVMGINGVPADQAPPLPAALNQTDVWTVINTVAFDHPFHFHGFFFQPLDPVTGAANASPEWRDTFNIPAKQTVKLAVHYDERPGMWMFHCHILDHADAGMMGMLLLK